MPPLTGTAGNALWHKLTRWHPARFRLALRVAFVSWSVTFFALAPLCYIACRAVHRESGHSAATRLQMARDTKRAEILAWYERQFVSLSQLAAGTETRSLYSELQAWGKSRGLKPGADFPVKAPGYQALWKHGVALRNFVDMGHYRDLFLIDAKSGQVLFTSENDIDNGVNLGSEKYRGSELAKCWKHCREAAEARVMDHAYASDYCIYPPGYNSQNLFIALPLWHERPPTAVIALQLNPAEINSILNNGRGYGTWGQAYLTGKDLQVRNIPRLQLQAWRHAGQPRPKAPAQPSRLALDYSWDYRDQYRARGVTRSTSLYNKPALTAYTRLFPDYDMLSGNLANEYDSFWSQAYQIRTPELVLVVEQPLSEAYAPARALSALIILTTMALLGIAWRVHWAIGKRLEDFTFQQSGGDT